MCKYIKLQNIIRIKEAQIPVCTIQPPTCTSGIATQKGLLFISWDSKPIPMYSLSSAKAKIPKI